MIILQIYNILLDIIIYYQYTIQNLKGDYMAIIYEKNFTDPNEKIVRQFTNCCGASDKGTEFGIVCRGNARIFQLCGKNQVEVSRLLGHEYCLM